jgi:hypothetical protein
MFRVVICNNIRPKEYTSHFTGTGNYLFLIKLAFSGDFVFKVPASQNLCKSPFIS